MTREFDRRAFGAAAIAATTAAALLARSEHTEAQTHGHAGPLLAAPAEKTVAPLPFAPGALPGLSERLIGSHHDNNYAAAVHKLNEIRQQISSADASRAGPYWSAYGSLRAAELGARNSTLLHELYFANLAPGQQPAANLAAMISQRYGSLERFTAQMRGCAMASSGWVALVADASSHTLELVQTEGHAFGAWDAAPLLVLDVFEHAYAIDYGANKNGYLDAFFRNVNWNEVATRTTRAIGRLIA